MISFGVKTLFMNMGRGMPVMIWSDGESKNNKCGCFVLFSCQLQISASVVVNLIELIPGTHPS